VALRNDSIEAIAEDTSDTLSLPLTLELRTMANGAQWPSNFVAALTVDYDNGEIVVNYPEALSEQIENLEYGDINSLPNSVIRPFIYRAQNDIKSVIERQALGDLMEMVGIVWAMGLLSLKTTRLKN